MIISRNYSVFSSNHICDTLYAEVMELKIVGAKKLGNYFNKKRFKNTIAASNGSEFPAFPRYKLT